MSSDDHDQLDDNRLDDDRLLVLAPDLRRILAPNPSPMTLDGTNTWLIGDPREVAPIVVDPGPDDPGHRSRILAACHGRVSAIVITHRHLDHSEGAPALSEATGCAVHAVDADWRIDSPGPVAGDRLSVGAAELAVHPTPGHTSDSISLVLSTPGAPTRLLTGDTILGRGTTVITYPDGDLGAYLKSLEVLARLIERQEIVQILPGHGPVLDHPAVVIERYRAHRSDRLDQVRAARRAGDRTPAEVVRRVYADVDPSLWPAAEQSVRAQFAYLDGFLGEV